MGRGRIAARGDLLSTALSVGIFGTLIEFARGVHFENVTRLARSSLAALAPPAAAIKKDCGAARLTFQRARILPSIGLYLPGQ